jgi:hypothetical protein
VESLAKEEKASFSFTQRLAHAIYQGYTSENTKFLSKEACRFHHLEHYYQQAALILAEKETLPRQVFIYRMQKTLELLRQEPSGQQLFPIKGQREQEIAPLHPLWDLIDLPAILKGSYRVAQSDTGGKILAVNVDLIQGKQGTTISLIRALAKKVFEEKIDRIQVTAHFQNEELQELLTKRYGLRATKAPWVFELPIEELLKVSPV